MEKLKEVSFDDIILENPDNKKEDIIDDKYVKRAVINSKLGADVKMWLLYTSPGPRDKRQSRMPSAA